MTNRADAAAALIDQVAAAAPSVPSPEDRGLALVAREGGFGDRYRVWRGRSGRRYLVTVMPLSEALRVEHAITLLVAIQPDGARRVLWAGDARSMPGIELTPGVRLEAHVHLLASSAEGRREALDDLVSGTQSYSSVLTVSAEASQASVGSTTPRRSSSRAVLRT
jgi:hypothetical protein